MYEEINFGRRPTDASVPPGNVPGTALITGASSGIGATYADRLAQRGHDLVLVARNRERLTTLASRLTDNTGRFIRVLVADLNNPTDLHRVEAVLRSDPGITMLVNNAGVGAPQLLLGSDVSQLVKMIDLNVSVPVRLTYAALQAFVQRGRGAIINISAVMGIAPEESNGVFGGTKAFALAFSQSLQKEFAEHGIRVQAVLPGATATEFWDLSGTSLDRISHHLVMEPEDVVDAALAGFDKGELVTIPFLPDRKDWEAYEAARQKLMPNLSLSSPALRYGAACFIADVEGFADSGHFVQPLHEIYPG